MQTVLRNIADERLKAYIIWLPVLRSDNRQWAIERTKEFADGRVRYFWDGEKLTGQIWRRVLALEAPLAWDTYFLYNQQAHWADQPSLPDFWMHQLSAEKKRHDIFLDVPAFERKARELLEPIE
jgi:hypothetical protein